MRVIILLLGSVFISLAGTAQNLVQNPSFENYFSMPCSWFISPGPFDDHMRDWYVPTFGTSDIFSTLVNPSCFAHCFSTDLNSVGHQAPRTGDVISAILTYGDGIDSPPNDYREYLAAELEQSLTPGQNYYVEFYVSLVDNATIATNNIGMRFSTTPISNYSTAGVLDYSPQINETTIITDTTNWVRISGTFEANSSYRYIVIGNFFEHNETDTTNVAPISQISANNSARYFIDDVAVQHVDCVTASPNVSICENDSTTLHASSETFVGWALAADPDNIIHTDTALTVWPSETTSYLVISECAPLEVTVMVTPSPVNTNVLGEDITFCQGESIVLDASALGGEYLWQDSTTLSALEIENTGTYWVSSTSGNCVEVDTITVSLNSIDVEIEVNENLLSCADHFDSYQWFFNGTPIEGATSFNYMATANGNYVVEVDSSTCTGVSPNLEFTLYTGLNELMWSDYFSVYPNPTNDQFFIESVRGKALSVTVVNQLGKRIRQMDIDAGKKAMLQISSSGVYFLQVEIDNTVFTKRILKL